MRAPRLTRLPIGRPAILLALCLLSALLPITLPAQAADCFWWNGQLNGQPVRLILDTGCSDLLLWRSTANRLGLKLTPVKMDSDHPKALWDTDQFILTLPLGRRRWGFPVTASGSAAARVSEAPVFFRNVDGVAGWPLIARRITRFDARHGKFELLDKVPTEVKQWSRFTILTNADVLVLEFPGGDATHTGLWIDTGSLGGEAVELAAPLWDKWVAAHPNKWSGIGANFQIDGLIPYQGTLASSFPIGSLTLANVDLHRIEERDWPGTAKNYAAQIGFGALKRFDLVVDGEHALAYLRPSKKWKPPPPIPPSQTSYTHSPGAAFAPWRNQTNGLTAYVLSPSPAYQSGIRTGDILLKVDRQDLKQWLDNPGKSWSSDPNYGFQKIEPSTNSPAATTTELTLRRQDQILQATVPRNQIAIIAPSSLNSVQRPPPAQ